MKKLAIILITLLMFGCEDDCESRYQVWRKIETQSMTSRSASQNVINKDGNYTNKYRKIN